MIDFIGYIAALLTTFSFLPQAIKVFRTNKTEDLSLLMFVCLNLGVFLWLIYGLMIKSNPVIYANLITLILALYILSKIYLNLRKTKT